MKRKRKQPRPDLFREKWVDLTFDLYNPANKRIVRKAAGDNRGIRSTAYDPMQSILQS